MSADRLFRVVLKAFVQSLLAGAATAVLVNGIWYLLTGRLPSRGMTMAVADVAVLVWSAGQAVRFRRKWRAVTDSSHRPALGQSIDVPHQPPTVGQGGDC